MTDTDVKTPTKRFADKHIKIVKGDPVAMEKLKQQLKEIDENSNSIRHPS